MEHLSKPTKMYTFWDFKHFKKILVLSVPTALSAILTFLAENINAAFVGSLGDSYMLSGAGLGNMCINCFWFSLYLGMNGATETLVS